jgi:hypothetical protein
VVYFSGSWRYNAATSFSIGYSTRQIGDDLAATYDDQRLVTTFTASRSGGGTAVYTDPTSLDDYGASGTFNASADSQLDDIAGWQVHLGTYNDYRIPNVSVDVWGRSQELALVVAGFNASLPFQIPQRLGVTGLPSPYPPGSFDQFIEGVTCTVDALTWRYTFNTSPYTPWQVAVVDDATTGLVSSGDTVLTGAESTTDTAITVTPGVANEWTTAGGDFPLDLNVGGERVTAVDCNNGTSIVSIDGTFEIARVAAWGGPSGGTFTDDAAHVHSGSHAGKLVTTGTPSQTFVRMPTVTTVPGDSYTATMWAFATGSTTNVQISIDWSDSGFVFLSGSSTTVTLSANTWTKVTVTATAPASAVHAGVGPTLQSSPATGKTIWVDDFSFTHNTGGSGSTQTFTVIRSINGIVKAHTAGESVDVWLPAIVAL